MQHEAGLAHHALVALRLVHFAALMAAFGAPMFRFYGVAGLPRPDEPAALALFDRWLARLVLGGALTALVSGLLIVPCVAAMMAGSSAAGLDPATLQVVLLDTAFGRIWCWHLGFAALLMLTAGANRLVPLGLVLALAGTSLATLALVGHAADQRGWLGLARELNQSLHLLAAGMWLGGLLPLGWLLRRAGGGDDPSFIELAREAVPPFSQMGYAAVALIALTGAINTLILVGGIGALFGTGYGRLLALKILLYLTMVAFALVNRFRLAPLLQRSPQPAAAAALHHSVLIEQAIGIAILAAVSLLGTWPPPR